MLSKVRVASRWLQSSECEIPPNKWVGFSSSEMTPEQTSRVWDLFHVSYGSIGEHVKNIQQLLSKYSLFWLNDTDGDCVVDAFLAYKKTRFGNKIAILGSDGGQVAKRAVAGKVTQLLATHGWYAEMSGRPAELAERAGIERVEDESTVRAVLGKELTWIGDGQYERHLEGLGKVKKALYGHPLVAAGRVASRYLKAGEDIQVIDFVRGYKQITGVRRIPIARNTDPKTKQEQIIIGNDEIDRLRIRIPGKDYLTDEEMGRLFDGEVVISEKVDGHPVVVLYGGYTFFAESLRLQHTVDYDNVPYSQMGWPDMTVVYEIMEGEVPPPYRKGQGTGKWLSRSEQESLCEMIGAPLAPLVYKGHLTPEKLPALADRLSSFGSSKAEGVVVKNLKAGVFGKFINLEFQKAISEESLWGDGVHPEMRGIKNVRRPKQALYSRIACKHLGVDKGSINITGLI